MKHSFKSWSILQESKILIRYDCHSSKYNRVIRNDPRQAILKKRFSFDFKDTGCKIYF